LFGGAEVARQLERLFVIDVAALHASLDYEPAEEFNKTIHLRAARDGGAQALVFRAGAGLLFELFGSRLPVKADGLPHVTLQV
jgi:hypothetical protein